MRLYVYIEVVIVFSLVTRGLAWISSVIMPDWHIITVDAMQVIPNSTPVRNACFLMGNSMLFGPATLFWGNCWYSESRSIQIGSHVMSTQKRSKKDQKGSLYRKETMFQSFPGS